MRRLAPLSLCLALASGVLVGLTSAPGAAQTSRSVLADGFEYTLGGWQTPTQPTGVPVWSRTGVGTDVGVFAAHVVGAGRSADQFLVSEPLSLGAAPVLSWRHRFDFEFSDGVRWDGGVVEYSADGGGSWADLATVASVPYSGVVHSGEGNPLGGRQAFTGAQAGWSTVSLPLTALGDSTVRLRFRVGADVTVSSPGWWIDEVLVTDEGTAPVPTPTAPTGITVTATSATSVAVGFSPAPAPPGRSVAAHEVICAPGSAGAGTTARGFTRQSEIEMQGLTAGVEYKCEVRGWTTAGFGAVGASAVVTPTARAARASRGANSAAPRGSDQGRTARDEHGEDYDALVTAGTSRAQSRGQRAAIGRLSHDGTPAQIHTVLGVPTTLRVARRGPIASPTPGVAPEVAAARGHLTRLAPAYRLGAEDLTAAREVGVQDVGRGASVVQFGAEVDGVEVWQERLNLVLDAQGGLVGATGYLLPRTVVAGEFALDPAAAASAAYTDLTDRRAGTRESGRRAGYTLVAGPEDFADPARVKPVMYRLPEGLVAGYYVELSVSDDDSTELVGYVVAADDGRVLQRRDLGHDQNAEYDYRAYADATADGLPFDGPQGTAGSPHPTGVPDGYASSFVAADLLRGPLTGEPWLPPGATETVGNNVDAYADRVGPDGYQPGSGDLRAQVTSPGVFDHTYDHAQGPLATAGQAMASATHLFYVTNHLHDWFYASGFDEQAGNAQQDNYGRGGLGGDRMRAETQDNSGMDNANMATPADGASPRMQMYNWTGRATSGIRRNPGGAQLTTGVAGFGPQAFEVTGQTVVARDGAGVSDSDGCEPLIGDGTMIGVIVLIDRGNCGFVTKAQNAENAGAIGVVIVNNAAGVQPPALGGTCAACTVPVLSVTLEDGNVLKSPPPSQTSITMVRSTSPDRDGGLDTTVVAHEWGHYLAARLVPGLGTQQARAMGEGWSDFVALLLMTRPEDVADLDGAFAVGAYATANLSPSPYYYGIRRAPYSTDMSKGALTFRHIADGQPLPTTVPFRPNGGPNSQVHNAGEVWATMLWECYAALLGETTGPSPRLTFAQAKRRMTDYLVVSLRATPADPTFLEARDALLMAVYAGDPADYHLFRSAFAKRGAGFGAVGPDRSSTTLVGVVESYSSDASPPEATVAVSGGDLGADGWHVSAPRVTASTTSGAGAPQLRCVLDDPTRASYFDLPDDPREPCDYAGGGARMPEGVHTLHAASVDFTGVPSTVAAATVKVDSIPPTLTCTNDVLWVGQSDGQVTARVSDATSGPVARTAGLAVDTSADGTFTATLDGEDAAGHVTSVECGYTVVADDQAPGVPSLGALPLFTSAASAPLAFKTTDALSGVASYDVRYRSATHKQAGLPAGWIPWPGGQSVPGTSYTASGLVAGTTYCFSVRARDRAGNVGDWSPQRCTARVLDDRALKRSKGWKQTTGAAFEAGAAVTTKVKGATLTLKKVRGSTLALRATTCKKCGVLDVFLGSKRIGRVTLKSASTRPAALVMVMVSAPLKGTVTLKTRNRRAVTIDGLGIAHR